MEKLSPTVLAGLEVMNSFNHHGNPSAQSVEESEDLMLRYRILESKAMDDRRQRQRVEDDLKFARHKLAERDRLLDQQRQQLSKQQTEIYQLQKQLDERTSVAAALKQQVEVMNAQLESANAEIRRLNDFRTRSVTLSTPLSGSKELSGSTGASARDRRGSVSDIITEKAKVLGLQRQIKTIKLVHEATSQAMEKDLMYEADLHSALTQRNLARGITPINDLLKAEASGEDYDESAATAVGMKRAASGLVSYDGIRRYGRGTFHFNFNEPLDLRTPHDVYLEAKMKTSPFQEEFASFRESIMKCAKEWKSTADTALSALYFIFTEREKGAKGGCILQNPKEDFQKEVKTALMKAKTGVLDLVRTFNENLQKVMANERRVKLAWLKEQRPAADFSVQVEIPPPEDPRIALLSEEIAFLKSRQAQIREEYNVKATDLEMQREKAEVNTQYLQQKVFALHSAVHNALHSVYKHRFRWAPRCPNHFAPLEKNASKKRQLEVGYNVQLGEAIDLEIKSLGAFADYFVSDQLFGVDLGGAFGAGSAPAAAAGNQPTATNETAGKENEVISLVLKRKEPVPMKKAKVDQARRLSTQLDSMLKQELAQRSEEESESEAVPVQKPQPERRTGVSPVARRDSGTPPVPPPRPTPISCASFAPDPSLSSEPGTLHRAESTGALKQLPSPNNAAAGPRRPSVCTPTAHAKPRPQSPRQGNRQATNSYFDASPAVVSSQVATPTVSSVTAPKPNVKPPGSSPVTPSMVASLIPTTINIELDPNSVSFAYQHRPSYGAVSTAAPKRSQQRTSGF